MPIMATYPFGMGHSDGKQLDLCIIADSGLYASLIECISHAYCYCKDYGIRLSHHTGARARSRTHRTIPPSFSNSTESVAFVRTSQQIHCSRARALSFAWRTIIVNFRKQQITPSLLLDGGGGLSPTPYFLPSPLLLRANPNLVQFRLFTYLILFLGQ